MQGEVLCRARQGDRVVGVGGSTYTATSVEHISNLSNEPVGVPGGFFGCLVRRVQRVQGLRDGL